MFGDLNKVTLIGRITADPQVKATSTGLAILPFNVATSRSYKAGEEWKQETEFTSCVMFGKQAESTSHRVKKGTKIYVEGRLKTRSWEGKDGKKNYKTEIIVENISLLADYLQKQDSPKREQEEPAPSEEDILGGGEDVIDPDDLPF